MQGQGDLAIPGIEHVMQPYHFGEGFGESEAAFAARAADALEQRILKPGPERVAAFIGEPVQGGAGVVIPTVGYWEAVGPICSKYGVLLICDEVICGFGRLGRWFGYQLYGLRPDIVTMAKGLSSGYLPISATVVSHPIVELLREKDSEFFHGFTYSGHPTCAAVPLLSSRGVTRPTHAHLRMAPLPGRRRGPRGCGAARARDDRHVHGHEQVLHGHRRSLACPGHDPAARF